MVPFLGNVHVYESEDDPDWAYYYHLTGRYKGGYFDITLCRWAKDSEHQARIAHTTDSPEEIKELLAKFEIYGY